MFGGGVVMNWELVWRQDRFNPLPLGRYVSRIYQFDEAFAANWYVAWSNDQANTMSFPDYLGALMQFDEHTRNGQYFRWAEATSTLSSGLPTPRDSRDRSPASRALGGRVASPSVHRLSQSNAAWRPGRLSRYSINRLWR